MREATIMKCKEALNLVYEDKLTHKEACLKSGLASSTFRKFRDSELGQQLIRQQQQKYFVEGEVIHVNDEEDYVLELLEPYPDWIWIDGDGKILRTDPPRYMKGSTVTVNLMLRLTKKNTGVKQNADFTLTVNPQ